MAGSSLGAITGYHFLAAVSWPGYSFLISGIFLMLLSHAAFFGRMSAVKYAFARLSATWYVIDDQGRNAVILCGNSVQMAIIPL